MIIDKSGSLCGPSQFKELKKPADHNVWLGGEEVDVQLIPNMNKKCAFHAKCSFWLSSTPPSNKAGAKVWKRSKHNCSNYWHHFLGQTSLLHFCTSSCLRFLSAWVKSGNLGDSLDCNCGELWGMQYCAYHTISTLAAHGPWLVM